MAKTETTTMLERAIYRATRKIGVYACFEVTIGIGGKERVDYMTLDSKGIWRCYEVKCSVADFRSKAAKTFVGHYNYFVMPRDVYEIVKDEIPQHVGVYLYGQCKKRAKKQELLITHDILMLSMTRSLYRDADKLYREEYDFNQTKREMEHLRMQNRSLQAQLREKIGI